MNEDRVGYGRPPTRFRFKKGSSGNPKGRPKRRREQLGEVIDGVLSGAIACRDGERMKKTTWREAILEKYVRRAAAGDLDAAAAILKLRAHATRRGEARIERILVEDWLPDYPGQTADQKTREAAASGADAARGAWWEKPETPKEQAQDAEPPHPSEQAKIHET